MNELHGNKPYDNRRKDEQQPKTILD